MGVIARTVVVAVLVTVLTVNMKPIKNQKDFGMADTDNQGIGLLNTIYNILGLNSEEEVSMLDSDEINKLALNAGFDEEQAKIMTAISLAESAGKPNAFNDNEKTGDLSYGLWQINMLDKPNFRMGTERRDQFGIEDNDALYDPNTNAMAAKNIFDKQGFDAWSVYKSGKYKEFL